MFFSPVIEDLGMYEATGCGWVGGQLKRVEKL